MENIEQNTFLNRLERFAEDQINKKALISIDSFANESTMSYSELYENAMRMLTYLQIEHDLQPGQKCMIVCENPLEFLVSFYAVTACGAAAIPVKAEFANDEFNKIKYISEDANVQIVLAGKSLGKVKDMLPDVKALSTSAYLDVEIKREVVQYSADNSEMIILYTSGSTNMPKGVPIKEEGLYKLLENYTKENNRNADSVTLCCLPVYHVFALVTLLLAGLWKGGRVVIMQPENFAANPLSWFSFVTSYEVTHSGAPNYMLGLLSKAAAETDKDLYDLSTIQSMILSTEFIQSETVDKFLSVAEPMGMNPESLTGSYGLTETSSLITLTPFNKRIQRAYVSEDFKVSNKYDSAIFKSTVLSVGSAIPGYAVAVIDESGQKITSYGTVGEVCVYGPSILNDYLNMDSQNENFIMIRDRKYLKTGDLGFICQSSDQNNRAELFICGRNKEILNVRGENYSPHYLEAICEKTINGAGSCVAVSVPRNDSEELIVFIEEKQHLSDLERQEMCNRVSEDLVRRVSLLPAEVVFSKDGSFLKTDSGKLKRGQMRKRYIDGTWKGKSVTLQAISDYAGKKAGVESFLLQYISRYVSDDITMQDSLVSLGLSSLQSQLLIAEVFNHYGVRISLNEFDWQDTIGHLSGLISSRLITEENQNQGISEHTFVKEIPLTAVQKAYLAGRNEEIDWGGVACQYYLEKDEENLDIGRFEKAVKALMKRHEALRGVIKSDQTLSILDDFCIPLTVQRPADEELQQLLKDTRKSMCNGMLPVDGSLFKIVLTELDADKKKWRIHLQLDMLCCDAMSILIFWNDLKQIYDGKYLQEIDSSLGQLVKEGMVVKTTDKQYWNEKEIPPAPQLPWNKSVGKISKGKISRRQIYLNDRTWKEYEHLSTELGITPTVFFMTLFSELLSGYGAGKKFSLSVTTLGRNLINQNASRLIGDFTKLMLFGVNLDDISLAENAVYLQSKLRQDLEHISYSSIDIMHDLAYVRENSDLYPIVFTSLLGLEQLIDGDTPFSENDFSLSTTPQAVLDHQLLPAGDGLLICWDAVEEAFEKGILDSMFDAYRKLIVKASNYDFWLEILRDLRNERDIKVQYEVNSTSKDLQICNMIAGIQYQAKYFPERRAIIYMHESYSYSRLQKKANQISELLLSKGIIKNDKVMIQMHKSFDLIAAIVGIVQMGAVYIPMPHDQPENRQLDIYHKSKAKCMVTDGCSSINENIPFLHIKESDDLNGIKPDVDIDIDQTAYIIYTSGSTGVPKGVAISHRSAMNTILAVNDYLHLKPTDCLIGLSSVSFDLSVYDIFGALRSGASLLVPTEEERIDPECWFKLCHDNNVTVWNTVPALMDILLDYCISLSKKPAGVSLRHIILSGDWIPLDLHGKLKAIIPEAKLTSMGGATEGSIWSNYFPVNKVEPEWASIPYGYPLPNQLFHVLDEFGRLAPNGVSGQLHIGGVGLAQGYYNETELTEKAFFVHKDTGERLYNTGDYGKYDDNGCLIFLGREDTQIKINGYRIELGEIKNVLGKIGYPDNTVNVIDDKNKGKKLKKLIAFVKSENEFQEAETKKEILEFLPAYFVPDQIIAVEQFPMTANGKLDMKQLIQMYNGRNEKTGKGRSSLENLSDDDNKVIELLKKELRIDKLTPDDSLAGLGISSLELIKLANQLESAFGHRARVNDIIHYRRIQDFLDYYRNTDAAKVQQEMEAFQEQERRLDDEIARVDPLYNHPVMKIMREELQTHRISAEDLLIDLGLSSLSVIRIANRLETFYGNRPSVHDMLRYQRVEDLIKFYDNNGDGNMDITEEQKMISNNKNLVLRCIEEMLNISGVTPDDSFSGLGVSSLEVIRIANQLEGMYGFRPTMQELIEQRSFRQLMNYYGDAKPEEHQETEESLERKRAIVLYNRCKDADIVIWPEGDKLRFKAPKGALTTELKANLSKEKAILLQYLNQKSAITSQDLTPLQVAYVLGRQNQYVLGDITAHYYVEYQVEDLDIERLQDAVNELIVRNEILRTVITPEGRVQVYTTNPGYIVEIVDEDDSERNLRAEMKDFQFVLGEWPMFDVKVTKRATEQIVHIGLDCLILDGWSINMFMHQLISAYNGEAVQVTNYTFRDYLEEERDWLKNKKYYRDAKEYWEKQILQLPPAPHLPLRNELTEIKKPEFSRVSFELEPELTFAFFSRLKQYDLTPSLVLCTAYMISLSKWSKTPDVTLNLTMFNRQPIHPDVHQVLGDFTNIALVGYRASRGQSFLRQIEPVKRELWNAIEYRSYNVINLLTRLAEIHGDIIAAPYVFTSLIDREGEGSEEVMARAGMKEVFAQTQTPQVVLDHQLYLKNGRLVLVLDYVKQAFELEMLIQMFQDYTDRVKRLAQIDDWSEFYE